MRIGAVGRDEVRELHHQRRYIGVQIERDEDRRRRTERRADPAQQLALAVVMALRRHGAVQLEIDRVRRFPLQRHRELSRHALERILRHPPAGLSGGPGQRHDRVTGRLRLLHEMRDAEIEPAENRSDRLALGDRRPWTGAHEIVPCGRRGDERVRLVHEAANGDAHGLASGPLSCTVRAHGVKFDPDRAPARLTARSHERHGSMRNDRIEVRPVAGALGAEILNIDLARDLGEETIGALRRAWLEHLVVFFRDQTLEPERFLRLARRFGEVIEYPFVKGIEGFPEITTEIGRENEKMNFGGLWHSDTAYLDRPPMATMLIAREVPSFGGDTLFANMYLAYETLSEGMRRMLDGLVAVNSSAKTDVTRTREDRLRDGAKQDAKQQYAAEHPVVRTHPETGRKALYVSFGHTVRFKDMTAEESAPILHYLFQHTARPEFTCRFRWQVGSVALWDNRCTQHNPINDYHGFRRVMHRVTLAGDRPR